MCDASQRIVELNGSVRTHIHWSSAFSAVALFWIMSKTSRKQSAQSLDSVEDEVGDLFCLGWSHVEIFANLLNVVGSENFWLSIGSAADTVDFLDEVHVLFLCMLAITLKCWQPVIIESGSQPEYLGSMISLMLRNEVEVRIHFEHEVVESRIPERSWMYGCPLEADVGIGSFWYIPPIVGCELAASLVAFEAQVVHQDYCRILYPHPICSLALA